MVREFGEAEIVKLPVAASGTVNNSTLNRQTKTAARRFKNMMNISFGS